MTRRKLKDRNIRKLARIGNSSLGVTIPLEYLKNLKWREKQKVVVTKKGRSLIIKDWQRLSKLKGEVGKK